MICIPGGREGSPILSWFGPLLSLLGTWRTVTHIVPRHFLHKTLCYTLIQFKTTHYDNKTWTSCELLLFSAILLPSLCRFKCNFLNGGSPRLLYRFWHLCTHTSPAFTWFEMKPRHESFSALHPVPKSLTPSDVLEVLREASGSLAFIIILPRYLSWIHALVHHQKPIFFKNHLSEFKLPSLL